jgi:pimeloyl-ACP methyl ester carboxylesterase
VDLSNLDQPEILEIISPLFYSPLYASDLFLPPASDPDYLIQVADGIRIGCNFRVADKGAPSLLFFHGNGETAANYDPVAPFYNGRGINLFVADYRGYVASNGAPTVSNMLDDGPPYL